MTEDNYEYGERVSVYIKYRTRGVIGGWATTVQYATVLSVHPSGLKALVMIDDNTGGFKKIVRTCNLRSHTKRHKIEHEL